MTYQVFARKWRPRQFGDMIGQSHVVKALTNALDHDRLHHAYLFTGMRGVGKTTIARVFAKSLNCEVNGVSANPCGECPTCVDIEAGRFFDLIEVDAASRTRVDETRELLDNVPYAPSSGRYKVYLIDEVHMFSNHSFNALLKTLEEPPAHVKFILATTDPQKVPVTILSRCLQFSLKRIPEHDLVAYLGKLLDAENIQWEEPALVHIARASEGSVRDSLSLVEQAAAFGGGSVTTSEVEAMLGRLSPGRVFDLVDAVASGDGVAVMQQVESLAEYAPDYALLLKEIMTVLHQVAVCQVTKAKPSGLYADRIVTLASGQSAADIQLYYQIGLHGRRDMPYSVDAQTALEMTLLRMVAFKPASVNNTPPLPPAVNADVTVAAAANGVASAAASDAASDAAIAPADKSSKPPVDPVAAAKPPTRARPSAQSNAVTADATKRNAIKPQAISSDATQLSPAEAKPKKNTSDQADSSRANTDNVKTNTDKLAPTALTDSDFTAERWPSIVESLGLNGMPKQLAKHTALLRLESDRLQLLLTPGHDHLNGPRFLQRLETAVSQTIGRTLKISITASETAVVTPAALEQQQADNALQSARDSIRTDPVVKAIVDTVDGVVDEASVEPVSQTTVQPDTH